MLRPAARYAALKRQIVAAGIGPSGYAQAKTSLIQELTDRARAESGLAPVPVWEKTMTASESSAGGDGTGR